MERLHERLPGEPPRPLPPREITEGVAAHIVYGAATGAFVTAARPRRESR